MIKELVDGRLVVTFHPGKIVASLEGRTWTYPQYMERVCSLCGNPLLATNSTNKCLLCKTCYGFSTVSYVSLYDKGIDDVVRKSVLALKNGRKFFADIFGMALSLILENHIYKSFHETLDRRKHHSSYPYWEVLLNAGGPVFRKEVFYLLC